MEERETLSAEELEVLFDKSGLESLSEHLERVNTYVGIIERWRFSPGSESEELARIGLAHSFGVLNDLGYLPVVFDDIERLVRYDTEDKPEHDLRELQRSLNLRNAGNRLLSDSEYKIPDPSGLDNAFISKREVVERDYWPTLRKVFGLTKVQK